MDKTYIPKAAEISQDWYLVDASGQNLGRLATQIASVLLGKHKPNFTPGMDTGDFVIVVNCEQVQVTGLTRAFARRRNGFTLRIARYLSARARVTGPGRFSFGPNANHLRSYGLLDCSIRNQSGVT